MASTIASAALPREGGEDCDVSLFRLYLLRAMYLLLVVGLGAVIVPGIVSHPLLDRGVIASLLGCIWLLAFIGLRYPLQMLPLLMFEFGWKSIWMIAYGLPQWSARPIAADLRRRLLRHRFWRDPGAAGDAVGLCLAPLCEGAGRALAVMAGWLAGDLT